jgi:PAS domain S-box-containing protein
VPHPRVGLLNQISVKVVQDRLQGCIMFLVCSWLSPSSALAQENSLTSTFLGWNILEFILGICVLQSGCILWLIWERARDRKIAETSKEVPPVLAGIVEDITEERDLREALHKTQEHIRSIVANVPGAVFRCHIPDIFRVVFSSEGVLQNTGYTPSDFIQGKRIYSDLLHPEDRPHCFEKIQSAIDRHDAYEITYRLYHADGDIRWIHEKGHATYDEKGLPVYLDGVSIDITHHHAIEEALRESEARFRSLAENVPDVICRMDASLRYIYINRTFERVTGKKIEDYLYKTLEEADIPKDLVDTWEQKRREVFKTGQPQATEFDFEGPNGRRTFHSVMVPECSADGEVQTILIVSRDITDILRIKQELNQRTRELDSFFDSALDLLAIADSNGNIQRLNPAWETTLGYPLSDLLGRRFLDLVHPEDLGPTLEALNEILNQKPVLSFTNRYRRIDGSYRWLEWRSQPVGEIMIGLARDITGRINSEAERLELERRLQHSQKMESLGILAGGIAHDFNNLLTVIMGNLDLSKESLGSDSHLWPELCEAEGAAKRAADLIRQMLAYAGQGRYLVQDVNVNDLLVQSAQMLTIPTSGSVAIRYELSSQVPPFRADPGQLGQVFNNLILNSIEAIDGNPGTITLKTSTVCIDHDYIGKNQMDEEILPGQYVLVEVSDTGCGMPPEVQEKVFDPFFSTKFAGRGLGMSAVLGIVHAYKGGISIESKAGFGTKIRVFFPLTPHRGE